MTIPLLICLGVALSALLFVGWRLMVMQSARGKLAATQADFSSQCDALKKRLGEIPDLDSEATRLKQEAQALRNNMSAAVAEFHKKKLAAEQAMAEKKQAADSEMAAVQGLISQMRSDLKLLDEETQFHEFGFYKPRYEFATAQGYQEKLEFIREQQKAMLSAGIAAEGHIEWTVNGSRSEGEKQIKQTIKLLLRAFNGECDASVARVKYNNVQVMEARINKAWEAINKLGGAQKVDISRMYHDLKLEELHLAHEYQEKLQEEREEQRRIRDQIRDEEQAQKEMERAKQEAEREEQRYADALAKARSDVEVAVGAKQTKLMGEIESLQRLLEEARSNKERAIAQAQLTRSGHVYVISNIGSFGEEVFKIGMTRRLEPKDRVRELGDASVPFEFDIHAVISTTDAPGLEATLHRLFRHRRLNMVNGRKEFFKVSLEEISKAVHENHGEIQFTLIAEAPEYRKTLAIIRDAKMEGRAPEPAFTRRDSERRAHNTVVLAP